MPTATLTKKPSKTFNPDTQLVRILEHMRRIPDGEYRVQDFTRPTAPCFIGYEAGTRICDLRSAGLVERVGFCERFAVYRLTELGKTVPLCDVPSIARR